jgi:hypothetical protein
MRFRCTQESASTTPRPPLFLENNMGFLRISPLLMIQLAFSLENQFRSKIAILGYITVYPISRHTQLPNWPIGFPLSAIVNGRLTFY